MSKTTWDNIKLPPLQLTYSRSLGKIVSASPELTGAVRSAVEEILSLHISNEVRPRMGSTHRRMQAYWAFFGANGYKPPRTLGQLQAMLADARKATREKLNGLPFTLGGKQYITADDPADLDEDLTSIEGSVSSLLDPRSTHQRKVDASSQLKAERRKTRAAEAVARRRKNPDKVSEIFHPVLELRGRLQGIYLNARRRGYLGSPDRWLKASRTARKCSEWFRGISVSRPNPLLWYASHSQQADARISFEQSRIVKEAKLPIRTVTASMSLRRRNRQIAGRYLPAAAGPPSSPTISEWWSYVVRKGKPFPFNAGVSQVSLELKPWKSMHGMDLSRALVDQFIIGIRDDVEMPAKVAAQFRCSRNFLIPRGPLNSSGRRFLLGIWKRDPCSLWLHESRGFRETLTAVCGSYRTGLANLYGKATSLTPHR